MSQNIFFASAQTLANRQDILKSLIAKFAFENKKVALFKATADGIADDSLEELTAAINDAAVHQVYGSTWEQIYENDQQAIVTAIDIYQKLQQDFDFVIVETGNPAYLPGFDSFGYEARLCANLGIPMSLIVDAKNLSGQNLLEMLTVTAKSVHHNHALLANVIVVDADIAPSKNTEKLTADIAAKTGLATGKTDPAINIVFSDTHNNSSDPAHKDITSVNLMAVKPCGCHSTAFTYEFCSSEANNLFNSTANWQKAHNVITPAAFRAALIARAQSNLKTIVLPEPEDDRVLQAAATVVEFKAATVILVGKENEVRARIAQLKLSALQEVKIVDPQDPQLLEQYSAEFARLRANKGVTLDQAREKLKDISYFATMMVHFGLADGMVSGATHTTAATIVPAFQIIKTKPGTSVVSSLFLMLLADRIYGFGDCAVIPDPTSEQLAEIAYSSALTISQFGIDPRVALLSYSSGTSGSGPAVEKVTAATKLLQEKHPELPATGPIQFDAASDPAVAAKKLPGDTIAGHANVFVFPNLEAGNIGYKAVQRTAQAVAVGPILQGLNKPVNDLSRGAQVEDIVNTIIITAVQAG